MSKHTPFIYISARNLIRSFQSKSKFEIGFNLSCARFYAAAMTETEPNVTFQWQTFGKKFFQHLILRFRLESRGHLCRFHGPLPWSWRTKARKKKKKYNHPSFIILHPLFLSPQVFTENLTRGEIFQEPPCHCSMAVEATTISSK